VTLNFNKLINKQSIFASDSSMQTKLPKFIIVQPIFNATILSSQSSSGNIVIDVTLFKTLLTLLCSTFELAHILIQNRLSI